MPASVMVNTQNLQNEFYPPVCTKFLNNLIEFTFLKERATFVFIKLMGGSRSIE